MLLLRENLMIILPIQTNLIAKSQYIWNKIAHDVYGYVIGFYYSPDSGTMLDVTPIGHNQHATDPVTEIVAATAAHFRPLIFVICRSDTDIPLFYSYQFD